MIDPEFKLGQSMRIRTRTTQTQNMTDTKQISFKYLKQENERKNDNNPLG